MEEIRSKIETQVPGVSIELAQLMEDLIGDLTAVPQPVQIKIYSDDQNTLDDTAQKVAAHIGKIQGIVDVDNGINPAGDALELHIRPEAAAAEGMDPQSIAQAVSDMLQGSVATEFQSGPKTVGRACAGRRRDEADRYGTRAVADPRAGWPSVRAEPRCRSRHGNRPA